MGVYQERCSWVVVKSEVQYLVLRLEFA